jgi:hypothetical protein
LSSSVYPKQAHGAADLPGQDLDGAVGAGLTAGHQPIAPIA